MWRVFQRKGIRLNDVFSYSCRQCGSCCHNIGVQLSPLDVWDLARKLGINTGEVLVQYAQLQLERRSARFYVFLRGVLDGPCSFLTNKLCSIYDARPGACRMHPIGSYMGLVEGEDGPVSFWGYEQRFSLSCPGWESGQVKQAKLRDYIAEQGAEERISVHLLYADFLNRLYREHDILSNREASVELVNRLFNLDLLAEQDINNTVAVNTAETGFTNVSANFMSRFAQAQDIAKETLAKKPRPKP